MHPTLMILCFDLLVEDHIALEAKYKHALDRLAQWEYFAEQKGLRRLTDHVIPPE